MLRIVNIFTLFSLIWTPTAYARPVAGDPQLDQLISNMGKGVDSEQAPSLQLKLNTILTRLETAQLELIRQEGNPQRITRVNHQLILVDSALENAFVASLWTE